MPLGAMGPLLLLALAAGALWAWQQRRARLGTPVRTIRLTHQHALHVLDLHGRRLIIGTGPAAAPRLVDGMPSESVPTAGGQEPWTPS